MAERPTSKAPSGDLLSSNMEKAEDKKEENRDGEEEKATKALNDAMAQLDSTTIKVYVSDPLTEGSWIKK